MLWYKLFGYSIPITRVAMLAMAAFGVLVTFLLSVELTSEVKGTPAFVPPVLLLVSPIFFTQSMMAQLDMPAMVFTLLALLLFLREHYHRHRSRVWRSCSRRKLDLRRQPSSFGILIWRRQYQHALKFIAGSSCVGHLDGRASSGNGLLDGQSRIRTL